MQEKTSALMKQNGQNKVHSHQIDFGKTKISRYSYYELLCRLNLIADLLNLSLSFIDLIHASSRARDKRESTQTSRVPVHAPEKLLIEFWKNLKQNCIR